jgi:hypothetical protein
MQSAMHLGVAFAIAAVGFPSAAATWAAALLVVGSAMQAAGVTLNWLTRAEDEFTDRSPGFVLNSTSSLAIWPGLAILWWGVVSRL